MTITEVSAKEISKTFSESLKAKSGLVCYFGIAKGPRHKENLHLLARFLSKGLYKILRRKMRTGQ